MSINQAFRAAVETAARFEPGKGKKYKYIKIRQVDGEVYSGKPLYWIFNNRSGAQLGVLSWYKPWRQYVFSSQPECIFNDGCLRDVLDFITIITAVEKERGR